MSVVELDKVFDKHVHCFILQRSHVKALRSMLLAIAASLFHRTE